MKQINFSVLFLLAILIFSSCGNGISNREEYLTDVKPESHSSIPLDFVNEKWNDLPFPYCFVVRTIESTTGTKTGLNPAHGQPGHRCEIAVGAPLSSAPAVTKAPANNVAVQSNGLPEKISVPAVATVPSAPAPAAATGSGLNPAHGQPGHRCEIAVGAPLPKQ